MKDIQKKLKEKGVDVSSLSPERQLEIYKDLFNDELSTRFFNYDCYQNDDEEWFAKCLKTIEVIPLSIKGDAYRNDLLNAMLFNSKIDFVCLSPTYCISSTILEWEDSLEPGFIVIRDGFVSKYFGEDVSQVL